MFLIQQSIEHTLTLLTEADTPWRGPQGMDNHSIRRVDKGLIKRQVSIPRYRRGGGGADAGRGPLGSPGLGHAVRPQRSPTRKVPRTITKARPYSITFQ